MGRNRQLGREMCWGLGSAAVDDPGQDLGGAEAAGEFRIVQVVSPQYVRGVGGFTLSFHRHSILRSRCCRQVFKGGEIARGHPIPRRNRSRGWIWACSPLDTLLGGGAAHPQTSAPQTPPLGSGSCISTLGGGAESPSPWNPRASGQ